MARLGIGILIIAQKPWETTVAELNNYREIYREINGTEAPKPIIASFIACHEDASVAQEMYEKYIRGYSRSALNHYEFHNKGLADVKGYEYYGALAKNIEKHGADEFVDFLAKLQVWGTPDQVYEQIMENQKRVDAAGLISIFSYGGMPQELSTKNMKLFAEKVLPRLKRQEVNGSVGGTRASVTIAAD